MMSGSHQQPDLIAETFVLETSDLLREVPAEPTDPLDPAAQRGPRRAIPPRPPADPLYTNP
jgi:hypothetical protein